MKAGTNEENSNESRDQWREKMTEPRMKKFNKIWVKRSTKSGNHVIVSP